MHLSLSGGNSSWALKANTAVYSNYLTDIDASVSKCANSFSVTKQIIMTSGGMKKVSHTKVFYPEHSATLPLSSLGAQKVATKTGTKSRCIAM